MIEQSDLSERRACRLVGFSRDSYRHPLQDDMTKELGGKIAEMAHAPALRLPANPRHAAPRIPGREP